MNYSHSHKGMEEEHMALSSELTTMALRLASWGLMVEAPLLLHLLPLMD